MLDVLCIKHHPQDDFGPGNCFLHAKFTEKAGGAYVSDKIGKDRG
jgi:hypothetical protein